MAPKASDAPFDGGNKGFTDNNTLLPDAGKVEIGKSRRQLFVVLSVVVFVRSDRPASCLIFHLSHSRFTAYHTTDPAQSWGKGFIREVKSTVGTYWVSEMTNFNQKTVAVSLLMFISVIAPTLTFGAVYGRNTENQIGAVETILATSWV